MGSLKESFRRNLFGEGEKGRRGEGGAASRSVSVCRVIQRNLWGEGEKRRRGKGGARAVERECVILESSVGAPIPGAHPGNLSIQL
jgi:hypothetical protein